ncbi:MAG: C1 family peptidase [Bacteroidales bacterium]|nr:C1 family peptidase [Bacteroidales bacterium]
MKRTVLVLVLAICCFVAKTQEEYKFKPIIDLGVSKVKSQDRTGTCWCYSTISFIESELLRMGKAEYDLSEMYIVRKVYEAKALRHIKTHGKSNFSQGGQAHDVMNEVVAYGLVPESIYSGKMYRSEIHDHKELSHVLSSFLSGVLKARNPTNVWFSAYNSILDVYMGETPKQFNVDGKMYTPQSFAKSLDIDVDNYVEITSYKNMPYYEKSSLLIPDNWSNDEYYNVHLDEFMEIMEYSLKQGYTFVWDGDVSDNGFSHKNNIAIVDDGNNKEKLYLTEPIKEKHISEDYRQEMFDNFNITDDHLMHIVGLVKDKDGTVYYKTKNSWGTESNTNGGYLNMSTEFMRLHSVAILVHKDAIPKKLKNKLGI